ncbi:hypothetical protein KI387_038614, partial [Taxus chinensis]
VKMSFAIPKHRLQFSSTVQPPPIPFNPLRGSGTVSTRIAVRASSASNHHGVGLGHWKNGFGLIRSDIKKSICIGGTLGIGIVTGIVLQFMGPCGGGNGGGWMGGWGGDGDGSGNFWSRIGAALAGEKREDDSEDFDKHGLSVGLEVPLKRLFDHKRYKISSIEIYDDRECKIITPESGDCFYEMFSVQPGGIYVKEDLQKEFNTLRSSGMFARLEMETITQPDGTLKLKVEFTESSWRGAERVRIVNVGLQKSSLGDMDPDWTDSEKRKYIRELKEDYKSRVKRTKHVLIPSSVVKRICRKLSNNYRLSARLLQEVRDDVQRWYHMNGYACAQVVNFGHLNTKEIICEVVQGDITKVDIQFQDKMGNLCEGNTKQELIIRELPDE